MFKKCDFSGNFSVNDNHALIFLAYSCADDADAGEIKKSRKSMRRRQRETANNQKQEEAPKRQWETHRSSVSSHSSGDEVKRQFFTNALFIN